MVVIGLDPSFTGFGICDGERTEVYSTSPVPGVLEEVSCIRRCDDILMHIDDFLDPLRADAPLAIYIEAPSMGLAHNVSIYQLGALYTQLHRYFIAQDYIVQQVSRHGVMSALFGKKVIAKEEVSGYAHRKFGVLFERDPGLNRLHAFLVCQFGLGCEAGEYSLTPAKRPGAKRKRVAK